VTAELACPVCGARHPVNAKVEADRDMLLAALESYEAENTILRKERDKLREALASSVVFKDIE
jgi:hypothetical protein